MARGASEDGTRRQKKWRQIDPWVKSIPKSGGRNFSFFCLHPSIQSKNILLNYFKLIRMPPLQGIIVKNVFKNISGGKYFYKQPVQSFNNNNSASANMSSWKRLGIRNYLQHKGKCLLQGAINLSCTMLCTLSSWLQVTGLLIKTHWIFLKSFYSNLVFE